MDYRYAKNALYFGINLAQNGRMTVFSFRPVMLSFGLGLESCGLVNITDSEVRISSKAMSIMNSFVNVNDYLWAMCNPMTIVHQ